MTTEISATGRLHTNLIYHLTRAVSEASDLPSIFDAALDCLGSSLGTPRSAILLFDSDGKMRFRAWRNLSETYRETVDGHSPWSPDERAPEPVLVPNVEADAALADFGAAFSAEGIGSLAFFPLLAESKLIGKFMVYYGEPHEFTESDVVTAQTIAAQVAFGIEQQLAKEANWRLQALNKQVIDAFGVAVYATDEAGTITRFNSAAAELWGRSPEIGVEKWCGSWKIFWPDGRQMDLSECPMGIALSEDRPVRGMEILVENPDGSRHNVMPYPTPVHDDDGRLVGALNVLVDVTDQSLARNELQAALRAKDDFLGQVSHELRTPLTQLSGNAHFLARRWLDVDEATKRDSVTEMMLQAQRLNRLVDNMLVLSRLERGVLPETEPQLIQRLIAPTIEEFTRRFPETRLEVALDPDLPPVESNPSTIDQVLWNLLTNAQKYGPREGPIAVTAQPAADGVAVAVRDDGPGVPEGDLPKLFEPYFRSSETSDHASGLGLGLSVCRRLIEAQDGKIRARRLEPGMEFAFELRQSPG